MLHLLSLERKRGKAQQRHGVDISVNPINTRAVLLELLYMTRIEDRPEHHPPAPPSPEDDPEMSFEAVLWNVVDDLFTYQKIAAALQGTEEDEDIADFVQQWKQGLAKYLQETTRLAVESFLAHLERFQAGRETITSPSPNQEAGNDESEQVPTP